MAEVAEKQNYCKPEVNNCDSIFIEDGRHPVVEKMMPMEQFIANDTFLDEKDNRLSIVTGPNMGKINLYETGSPNCPYGSNREFCSCKKCKNRSCR